MSDKERLAAMSKKVICNPPVVAAAETATKLCEGGYATVEEIKKITACEDRFINEMHGIFGEIHERLLLDE